MFLILGFFGAIWIYILAKKVNQRPLVWAFSAFLSVILAQFVFALIGSIVFLINYGITTPEDVTQKFTAMVEAHDTAYIIFSTLFSMIPVWLMARSLTSKATDNNQDLQ